MERSSLMKKETVMRHRIAFVTKNSVCRIIPGHLVAGRGDTVSFSAHGADVEVYFPKHTIFTSMNPQPASKQNAPAAKPPRAQAKAPSLFILKNGGPAVELEVKARAGAGSYQFTAHCDKTKSFAVAGSDGEIIIQT
jgi:hypothetical protein